MAARKKEPTAEDIESWKQAGEQFTRHPEDTSIDEAFAGLPQNDTCIDLFRINAQGGRPLYLESVQPPVFTLAYVTSRFGGGRYIASAKYADGTRVKYPFEIEGEPIPIRRLGPGVGVEPLPNLGRQIMQEIRTHPSSGDEFENIPSDQGLVPVMLAMLKELKGSKESMLREMMMYKELFGTQQPAGPQATIDQVTSLLQKGIELAQKSGGGDANPWIQALQEFREPIGKAMDTLQLALATRGQTAQAPPMRPAQAPAMPGAGQPATSPQPESTGDPMQLAILNQFRTVLPMLVNGAAKGTDHGLYVDLILDQTPEAIYPKLRDWLIKPDCLDMLAKYEPGIRYQQDWWIALRSSLIESLTEEIGHGVAPVQSTENSEPSTVDPATSKPVA